MALLGCILLNHLAFAKAVYYPLPERVAHSDLIARVQVISIRPLPGAHTSPSDPLPYRSIARVRINQAIKGAVQNSEIDLEFDNGLGCPNVLYYRLEDCLLFANRLKNGHYVTFDFMYGSYGIIHDKVQSWQGDVSGTLPLTQVVGQIEKYLHRSSYRKRGKP